MNLVRSCTVREDVLGLKLIGVKQWQGQTTPVTAAATTSTHSTPNMMNKHNNKKIVSDDQGAVKEYMGKITTLSNIYNEHSILRSEEGGGERGN